MYKKLFVSLFAVALIFGFAGASMACNGCFGGVAFGDLDVSAFAYGGALDYDIQSIPNGIAGGISGAGGIAGADADGSVFNGTISGDVSAVAGGLTNTDAYRFNPHMGDRSIGVGSRSESYAITSGYANINVDPDGRMICGFIPTAGGIVDADIFGIAAQGTLNGSALWESPRYFDSEGFTGGIAGQGSIGGFYGGAFAMSGPDYSSWDRRWVEKTYIDRCGRERTYWTREWVEIPVDSYAGAEIGAEVEMGGSSYSDSYRYVDWGCGYKTEGMGTFVGANTYVNSYGYSYDNANGLGYANSHVGGGWMAAGGAAAMTTQHAPGFGGATATAVGYYVGAGGLNTNFNGSVNGYTGTSVTTFNGMNGSINSAHAGMSVSSNVSSNHPN